MTHILVRPGEAGAEKVARGLLDTAEALGLPAAVVEWSPSLGGFKVPEEVASYYASSQEPVEDHGPVAAPDVDEHEENNPDVDTDEENRQATTGTGEHETPALSPLQQAMAASQETAGPRRYSDEEKAAAVAAVLEQGRTIADVAAELGASATSVSKWVTAAKEAEGGAV